MTAEDRYIVDLKDLKAVRFECAACGTAVSIPMARWDQPAHQCPSCGVPWGTSQQAFEMINKLRVAIQGVTALMSAKDKPYRLCFEIDRPKL